MSWLRTFVAICASVLVLVVVALVLLVSFVDLGLSGHGIAAMFIGALLTIAVTMVLMGLLFMSDRGGHDASAHEAGIRKEVPHEGPPSS
jgi:uncharacterized membrane protein (DUF485 family)